MSIRPSRRTRAWILCLAATPPLYALAAPGDPVGVDTPQTGQSANHARANDDADDAVRELPAVQVQARGYDLRPATRHAQVGPLGVRDVLDTPYSLSVVPAEQLADQQVKSVQDALRNLPWVQADSVRPQSRGVQGSVIQNTRADGFNIVGTTDYPIEQFERIEVLNGVAGSLYGPATASGIFSFVQKRAGHDGASTLRLGATDSGSLSAHADLWTPLGRDGRWRLRTNLLQDIGPSYVSGSRLRRTFAGVALDADLGEATELQFNASRYRYSRHGLPGSFGVAAGVSFPRPVDPERVGYGQSYAGNDDTTRMASSRVIHHLGAGWKLEAGLSRQIVDRKARSVSNTLTDNLGHYTTTGSPTTASRFTVTGNQLSLSGRAATGRWSHDLVIAGNGFDWDNYNPVGARTLTLGRASLSAPARYAEPAWPVFTHRYRTASQQQQSLILADTIGLAERWQLMLSTSYSWMKLRNYTSTGALSRRSSDTGASPFASLLYRPTQASSVYLSYADTLQPGDSAPSGTANAGAILDPYRSQQWELGYKARLASLDVSAALFRIERPYAYTDTSVRIDGLPVYRSAGRQLNRGVELGATGTVTPALSVSAGLAWLDPRITRSANAASVDKRIVGLSRWSASLGADLRLPVVPGLSTNARVVAVDRRPANNANTDWIAGYAVVDLGLRLQRSLGGHEAIWRLTLNNVGDKRYWTNVVAGGLNGYSGTGNASATVGAPRTLSFGLQLAL